MAFLTSHMYIDQPQNFSWISGNPSVIGAWYGLPPLLSQAGYGKVDAGLFLKKYLNYDLGEELSSYVFADTLAARLLPNGGVCMLAIDVPGFKACIDTATETLSYLHMGVFANYYLSQKALRCDSVFQRDSRNVKKDNKNDIIRQGQSGKIGGDAYAAISCFKN